MAESLLQRAADPMSAPLHTKLYFSNMIEIRSAQSDQIRTNNQMSFGTSAITFAARQSCERVVKGALEHAS